MTERDMKKSGSKFQMQLINGEAVPLKSAEVVQKKKKEYKICPKKLFQDSSKSKGTRAVSRDSQMGNNLPSAVENFFPFEDSQSEVTTIQKNSRTQNGKYENTRLQPSQACKNGVSYKNGGTSPKIMQESTDSSSGTSAMKSPKASVKEKWHCSFCKQHFTLHEQLEHVDAQHKKKKKVMPVHDVW